MNNLQINQPKMNTNAPAFTFKAAGPSEGWYGVTVPSQFFVSG